MRILQLHTRYRERGGEDAVVDAEYRVLRDAGHHVDQHIAENPTGSVAAAAALAGSIWNPASARRALQAITSTRPDVAHLHNTWFAHSPSIVTALRRRRVPIVMTVHNYRLACVNALFLRDGRPCEDCLDRSVLEAVRHRCYRGGRATSAVSAVGIAVHRRLGTWSDSVDRFVVLSEFARNRLVRAGLPPERMTLGANFVADPGERPAPPSASRDVMFVGRISAEKGLQVLVDAWRTAPPAQLRLVVVGDGPVRRAVEAGAPDGVRFVGRLPSTEVLKRLMHARALIVPSIWYEGQPVTALEGMAAGTPLIVSDIGGLPEVLGLGEDRSAGWTAPPRDPVALAQALQVLADDTAVDERGARARAHFLSRFTATAALSRLEELYRSTHWSRDLDQN